MEEKNIIVINGKKIDLSRLSDEDLIKLQKAMKKEESKYKKIIQMYREKYPFLKDIK